VRPATEQLDRRSSEEKSQAVPWAAAEKRLAAAQIAWIVTVPPTRAYGHDKGDPFGQTNYRY